VSSSSWTDFAPEPEALEEDDIVGTDAKAGEYSLTATVGEAQLIRGNYEPAFARSSRSRSETAEPLVARCGRAQR
jgi:hypothetical protein